ncbi:CAF17-like 4Fe-4S cluster assembly/insertion protein YgfZ [Komagataeibacter swingsii]|uniref:Folate-binding protein YgfZ n=1 Tax=Komagataeibacter swingsii TaxID=215220 RepID=A0A850NU88_9PROT|nr:folate-binding protein YgfZ [Komagataeibacter swingsii]AHI25699.1 folate-binding protein YgfZ [Komagataeibacter xylinus E25]NVN35995.1 folate-binding protein YgfZ [Komagataeibacter swingsii]RFP02384.1 aminomethyltransferase [Komagataeibacter xylinus]RFP03564.1 aminomethyltransferase [Komagataeibacter xylinus]
MARIAHLSDRAVLSISGADRVSFLQGLVSNDMTAVAPGHAVWTAFLSAQGKWLADFFVFADPEGVRLLLDCDATQATMLRQGLSRYRLRADVEISETGYAVHAAWGEGFTAPDGYPAAPDPRLPQAGWRFLLGRPTASPSADDVDYDLLRLSLGLPDGVRDCESGKTLLLEANFDQLNGISWTKGCYMGQELTARTRYRGLVRRHLLPVTSHHDLPAPGTPILSGATTVGEMRSSRDKVGMAMIRNEHINDTGLTIGGHALHVHVPQWFTLPARAE